MKKEIVETIRETLYLKEDQVSDMTRIEDIAKDSMDIIELMAVLSDRYSVTMSPAQMNKIRTVADIVEYVIRHKGTHTDKNSMTNF